MASASLLAKSTIYSDRLEFPKTWVFPNSCLFGSFFVWDGRIKKHTFSLMEGLGSNQVVNQNNDLLTTKLIFGHSLPNLSLYMIPIYSPLHDMTLDVARM